VWTVIERAKKNKAILLITHSMEEADVLGDRIGNNRLLFELVF
jgi:ABC-type nitrate/sulfonate/bicarbonate transport system ATPase subunit